MQKLKQGLLQNSLIVLIYFLIFSPSFTQSTVTLSFDNPSMAPTSCFTIFTEEGIPQQLVNNSGSCSYDYSTGNGGELWLFPATLSVDLSSLGSIVQVEIDINDFCGTGCSQASLLNNSVVVHNTSNMMVGSAETLLLDNSNMLAVDELTMSSFEGLFLEIRITYINADPCNGTGDSDGDDVCDALDICPGFDDRIDRDCNGIPDYCDDCDINRTMVEASESGDNLEYASINDITSSQVIESGADVTFNAGFQVNLISGFEVESGAVFAAVIEGCALPSF